MGNNEKDFALAEHLMSLLSTVASPDDAMEYESALERQQNLFELKEKIDSDVDDVRQARNRVDALDRDLAEIRDAWGEEVFDVASRIDLDGASRSFQHLINTLKRAHKGAQGLPVRILWRVFSGARLETASTAWTEAKPHFNMLGLETNFELDETSLPNALSIAEEYERRLDVALQIQNYKAAFGVLQSKLTLEELSRKSFDLKQKIAANSEGLWHYWMALQSTRLTDGDRKALAMYSATLQAMIESRGDDPKAARQIARRYYKIFPEIRRLLPCWAVTSLSAKGKVPFAPNFFDLLIIDEASQCDIASALPLLYRSKRAVIIGDPMQLKHISGITVEKDYRLQEKHGISDEYAGWSYSTNSLFNLAVGIISAKELTMLRDHHRSHADIINFSNEYFYKGKLRVATRYDRLKRPSPNGPAVIWTDQQGAVRRPANGGAVNAQEADAVVAQIASLLRRGYSGTIGVVTPFRAQANLIRANIAGSDGLTKQLARSDLIVDTVHRFQGDERDVMFFSPVVAAGISTGALGFLRSNGNLFNVAITRARSLLHVVGDKNAALGSGVGYLSAFAEYSSQLALDAESVEVPQPELGRDYPPVVHPERVSDWERIFYVSLYDEGIRPVPQYDVEQYTLDFAVFDGDRKLNIEVDGERYHRDWTGELCRRDQIRNQRMIEMGWEVKRFWVYQFRDQQAQCVNWVNSWLSKSC
jgi:very-short-patch-repair endonuclease